MAFPPLKSGYYFKRENSWKKGRKTVKSIFNQSLKLSILFLTNALELFS